MFTITSEQDLFYKGAAIFILLLCIVIIVVGIILIHELPYNIAKKRNHPQKDAIRCMSIMGLFLIPLWFFAMIWAYMKNKSFGAASVKNTNIELAEIIVDGNSFVVDKNELLKIAKNNNTPLTYSIIKTTL